jgi:beta-phosphoglucomutase-like phosphatase (HAD superfamily)
LDFDGVLVDSEPAHLAAFNDVLAPLGVSIGEAEYLEHYLSLDDAGVFRAALGERALSLDEAQLAALVSAKAPRFMDRFGAGFRIFPGAVELVQRRAARGPVGIVSGAFETEIVFALDRMGVRRHVAFIIDADGSPASKPDPAPFRLAREELVRRGYRGQIVVVEDSLGGVASAKGAGLRCAAVAHSYSVPDLLRAGADVAAPDLPSLTDGLLEGAP